MSTRGVSKGSRTVRGLLSLARRLRREERGGVIVLLAVMGVGLAAMTSFVVDYGRVMNAQTELQAAANAAALSAAIDLPDGTQASNTASSFSATAGGKNTRPDLPSVTTTAQPRCLTFLVNLGLNCDGSATFNAIRVDQDADVPLLFLGGIGIPGIHVHATAMAAIKTVSPYPLDVMIVLDRTGSMSEACSAGPSKIVCARNGIHSFVQAMRPSVDRIGFAVFPPATSVANRCSSVSGSSYDTQSNPYVVVPLSNDFKVSDSASDWNPGSNLVQTVNCIQVGGVTSYADALLAAKTELNTNGRANAQDVIIFFTDGEANYGPLWHGVSSVYRTNPCGQAITNAASLTAGAPPAGAPPKFIAGTWVYTIMYATDQTRRCTGYAIKPAGWPATPAWNCAPSTSGTLFPDHSFDTPVNPIWRDPGPDLGYYCQERPHVSAYDALRGMASIGWDGNPRFYYQPVSGDLTDLFRRIAADLSATRLLPDTTQ